MTDLQEEQLGELAYEIKQSFEMAMIEPVTWDAPVPDMLEYLEILGYKIRKPDVKKEEEKS